jgi:hypothetical protein
MRLEEHSNIQLEWCKHILHHDARLNDAQPVYSQICDTQHDDYQLNNTRHNDQQHKDTQHSAQLPKDTSY